MMISFSPAIPSRRDFEWCYYLRRLGPSGDVMERTLHDIGVLDHSGWADWQPSALTGTGAPTEVIFAADSTAIRVTTEVDDPGKSPEGRLDKACKIMADLGGTPPGGALRDILAVAQSADALTYGARLEISQDGGTRTTSLLVELPCSADDLGVLMMPAVGAALQDIGKDAIKLTTLGYHGRSGALTLHGVIRGANKEHLPLLADIAQVSPDYLAMAIDGLAETTDCSALPVRDLCFGLTGSGVGQPPVLSLYLPAREMLGSDAAIKRRIMACGGSRLNGYAALLDHLPPTKPNGRTHHGRIGLTARRGAMPILSVSVAAPWNDPSEFDTWSRGD